jgi:hypothetical protein
MSSSEWIDAVVSAGSIRGPYTQPLLPSLGRALREERWPLPLAIRTLRLRELAVLERRAMEQKKESTLRRVIKCWIF